MQSVLAMQPPCRATSSGVRAKFVQAIRDAAVRADRKWPGRLVAFRHVDAVEALDARTLRDIGFSTWDASRDAQRERESLQTRIDGGYRG